MRAALLSVLVPLYNEEEFIGPLLERVLAAPLPDGMGREIVVVDDGSTDGSAEVAERMAAAHPEIRVVRHTRNRGKGAAIRTAVEQPRGDIAIIQDADLEYDPARVPEPAAAACSRARPTWSSDRASWSRASAGCCTSGTRWPIIC